MIPRSLMDRTSWHRLPLPPGVLLLGLSLAVLLVGLGAPLVDAQSCNAHGDCRGSDVACVNGSCIRISCNTDDDCLSLFPLCQNGFCRGGACSADGDCPSSLGCVAGFCLKVACRNDGDCSSGQSCVSHRCRDCVSSAQCGLNGVCTNNNCVCVECTRPTQCAFDQKCSADNRCVAFCEEGRVFVSASDGNRVCRACVNPDTARRCNEFPGCSSANNTICAQGFCISRCSIDPPDFDQLRDELANLRYQLDPSGTPNCPACRAIFDLAPVRTALERAGINQPVGVRVLQPTGRVLADFGTVNPNKGSWASVPLRAQPRLQGALTKDGGCGFSVEIRTVAGAARAVQAPICLRPR